MAEDKKIETTEDKRTAFIKMMLYSWKQWRQMMLPDLGYHGLQLVKSASRGFVYVPDEQMEAFNAAVMELKETEPKYYTVLLEHYVYHRTFEEISDDMDLTRGAVCKICRRALKKLDLLCEQQGV